MNPDDLKTSSINTWCPGCGNFAILNAIKMVLQSLAQEGNGLENIVFVSGIGCHAKIVDYVKVNSFYSLHGRGVPAAEGIKLANPKLKVIVFVGDGDAYGEGLEHTIFAAKRNIDITVIVHNNRLYGLTTGQYSPTSPLGFKGKSTVDGTKEKPLNPLEMMLSCGASFIGRGTSHGIDLLKSLFKEAILHKGFALIDVLQVCFTYFNLYDYYSKHTYELKDHNSSDYMQALNKIREFNYSDESKIPLGLFYKQDLPVFDENFCKKEKKEVDKSKEIQNILTSKV